MKGIVIYFSQTGNTKKIAEAIHKGITSAGFQCDIAKLKDVSPEKLVKYDLIGLGSPVFTYREPYNVRLFVERMPSLEGKQSFMFCTHATVLGAYFNSLGSALAKRKLTNIGTYDCYASVLLQPMPVPYFTDGHPDDVDLQEATDFGKEMADHSRKIFKGATHLIPKLALAEDKPFIITIHTDMKLNREKCLYPKCKLCIENCPMNSIDLSVDPPILKRDCIECWFCENICPQGALEYDWEPLFRVTSRRARNKYQRAVDKAVAQGRFRRYVAEVGWDTPYYKVYSRHPRFPLQSGR